MILRIQIQIRTLLSFNILLLTKRNMFRSFFKLFGPRQIGLIGGISFLKFKPYFMTSDQNERINQKLKRKLNEKFHNRKDISFELTEEFRKNMVIFTGNSNKALAEEIAQILKVDLGHIKVGRFADGQVSIQIGDNVRSKNVFIIQSTCPPVNQNLVELLLMVSTMRRASAEKINVIIPYYGYARQDRKTAPRVPISAADVARLLETVGVDRVVLVDVHSGQIQGFFGPRVPVDNLEANLVALNYFAEQNKFPLKDIVVISPDAGGVTRAKNFQGLLSSVGVKDTNLAMIIKQRMGAGKIGSMHLVGNVEGKNVIIVDDIIDTGGTLCEATKVLKEKGALSVSCFATHGLFSGKALSNIENSKLDQVIVTNSIPAKEGEQNINRIIRLSVAPILAEAIFRIQTRTSISSLFSIPKT